MTGTSNAPIGTLNNQFVWNQTGSGNSTDDDELYSFTMTSPTTLAIEVNGLVATRTIPSGTVVFLSSGGAGSSYDDLLLSQASSGSTSGVALLQAPSGAGTPYTMTISPATTNSPPAPPPVLPSPPTSSPQAPSPGANDDSAYVGTRQAKKGILIDVLANDDARGGAFDLRSLALEDQPDNGTASIRKGKIRYVPLKGFNGEDSLTYSVTDRAGNLSNEASVSITVQGGVRRGMRASEPSFSDEAPIAASDHAPPVLLADLLSAKALFEGSERVLDSLGDRREYSGASAASILASLVTEPGN